MSERSSPRKELRSTWLVIPLRSQGAWARVATQWAFPIHPFPKRSPDQSPSWGSCCCLKWLKVEGGIWVSLSIVVYSEDFLSPSPYVALSPAMPVSRPGLQLRCQQTAEAADSRAGKQEQVGRCGAGRRCGAQLALGKGTHFFFPETLQTLGFAFFVQFLEQCRGRCCPPPPRKYTHMSFLGQSCPTSCLDIARNPLGLPEVFLQGSALSPMFLNIYMKLLAEVIRRLGLCCPQYADITHGCTCYYHPILGWGGGGRA